MKKLNSTTTWTQFHPILTHTLLEWTKMSVLRTLTILYPLSRAPPFSCKYILNRDVGSRGASPDFGSALTARSPHPPPNFFGHPFRSLAGMELYRPVCFFFIFSILKTYALSFYRTQNVLCRSKFFVSDQKFIYILCQSQTFCARQKDDLHSVKLFFVPAQKSLKRH